MSLEFDYVIVVGGSAGAALAARLSESPQARVLLLEAGADKWRGSGGPLNVADLRSPSPFSRLFVEAAQQAGIAFNPDFNGPTQEGCGLYQVTQRNGERWSVARAYLEPVRGRANLAVFTNAAARRIVFEGRRAVGVVFERGGVEQFVGAEREVILCAGSLQSPQLLMLSGIGPAAHLRVVDASIMPTLLSGNSNAAAVMIAGKATDMMR